MGKLILILGGARSGKSSYAEELAAELGGKVAYLATAQALDGEMERRIQKHQDERPEEWDTFEIPLDIAGVYKEHMGQYDVVLLDCLTLLTTNVLMAHTSDIDHPDDVLITEKGVLEVEALLELIQRDDASWIVVSNEVGLGLVPAYPSGRVYRDLLGLINKLFAMQADEVLFMIAGLPMKMEKKK